MKKLYIYVDETGQDTAGRLFIVSAIVVEEERDVVETRLTHLEQSSGKGTVRWIKTSLRHKQRYLGQVFQSNLFVGKLFFSHFTNTTHYVDATLLTISRAIHHKKGASPYTATVFIEGLSKHQVVRFPRALRKVIGVRVHKVRPLPHRSSSTVRLADALAGFVRDYLEGEDWILAKVPNLRKVGILIFLESPYAQAVKQHIIEELRVEIKKVELSWLDPPSIDMTYGQRSRLAVPIS